MNDDGRPFPDRYRTRPVEIEAIQINDPDDAAAAAAWVRGHLGQAKAVPGGMALRTRKDITSASYGDWIIRDDAGEFYPCKPDTFDATYEAAS